MNKIKNIFAIKHKINIYKYKLIFTIKIGLFKVNTYAYK